MDSKYAELFDLSDTAKDHTDKYYYQIIPIININIYYNILKYDIEIINGNPLDTHLWTEFKYALLNYEKEWKINVFIWCKNNNICIDWTRLKNKPTRYYQVHLALIDTYPEKVKFPNIKLCIDQSI